MNMVWFATKWTGVASAWFLSIIIVMGTNGLLDVFGKFGSLLNLPSVHMTQKADLDAEKKHQAKVDKMIKRNANRSQRRIANAMKRIPADEITSLLGPIGLLAGGGFVVYDLADMCYEINDANELLELIGEPVMKNPISDNCDKVQRGSSYVVENFKKGWSVVVTKTKNGWVQTVQWFEHATDKVSDLWYEKKRTVLIKEADF